MTDVLPPSTTIPVTMVPATVGSVKVAAAPAGAPSTVPAAMSMAAMEMTVVAAMTPVESTTTIASFCGGQTRTTEEQRNQQQVAKSFHLIVPYKRTCEVGRTEALMPATASTPSGTRLNAGC